MVDRRLGTAFALALSLLLPLGVAGPARAGALGVPGYEWVFSNFESDGAGGFTGPFELVAEEQVGGAVDEPFTLTVTGADHLQVFATEGAGEFWARARAPLGGEDVGDTVGGRSELTVTKIFRKDVSDATLTFTIPNSVLSVRDFRGDSDRIVHARVLHTLDAGGVFSFSEEAVLEGIREEWEFEENGTGVLPWDIEFGALDESSVVFSFPAPFEQEVDLSGLPNGTEFTVTYHVVADAIDTSNSKSLALAAGGINSVDDLPGISFDFTGLTPIDVPEAGAPALLATGAAVLATLRRRTRRA